MNKQRLIEKYKRLEGVWDAPGAETARQIFLQDLKQLDEPEKVKVSEEEAKFLKTFDFNCESDVTTALYHVSRTGWGYYLTDNDGIELKDLTEGFRDIENRKRLIKAILDGYTIKKDKRYRVEMKGMCEENTYLTFRFGHTWMLSNFEECEEFRLHHTRKELEDANFGWVFDCEGIEIEEVTE